MIVTVDSNLTLIDTPLKLKKQIEKELTLDNPEYLKRKILNLPVWNINKKIKLYSYIEDDLVIPRGYCFRLVQLVKESKTLCEWDIQKLKCEPIEYNSSIQLRDYQEAGTKALDKISSGVFIMPCGAGKTQLGLEIIARLGQPALWLTHTKDLLKQSLDRAKSTLGLERGQYGIIGGGSFTIGSHITFATVQTMANRDLSETKDKFGCVVIDEAHHCFKNPNKVGQFQKVISQLPAYYRIGLTASEHRSDGLIETMFHEIGPKIYEVTQDELSENNMVMTPIVNFINTDFNYESHDERFNFSSMLKEMAGDLSRNKLIIEKLKEYGKGNCNLVLGDSLAHLEELKNAVGGAFICGITPTKQREEILENMRKGKAKYLFATYQLAKEGLDIPRLNRLFLITPKKDKVVIQQSVGRISRPFSGKTNAIVYDFYDKNVGVCIAQSKKRINDVYKKLGCELINDPRKRRKVV